MPKIVPSNVSKTERAKLKGLLSKKIAKLNSAKGVEDFLEDLLTESELVMIFRRLQIAKMLMDNCLYWQIRNELGVGYDTIQSIRGRLDRGSGGYLKFIKDLKV